MSEQPTNASVRAIVGPNGRIEVKQFNGIQGWHSGYLTPDEARKLANELQRLADAMETADVLD